MKNVRPRGHFAIWLTLFLCAFALAGCDRGGRLAQLTPQPPAETPLVLGVTMEAPSNGAPVTAPPLPTSTYDPARPAWTILYYASADNDRAAYVWDDLNEMEAAGATDQVQVVAQVDWPDDGPAGTAEGARYLIQSDADPNRLLSSPVATLGETNLGDPAALADFLTWAIASYPANRYALVLGDFGGGWQGCCLDTAVGQPDTSDHLSLPDLDQALAAAQGQTGRVRLEVIAFAASLMSQIDILQAIQPYAAYAVASPGLVPGSGWDFQPVLAQLNADPLIDGRQFSGDLVSAFVNTQRQLQGDEFVTMVAVDLSRAPQLAAAVDGLAAALSADPGLYTAIAADARRGAPTYGSAALTDADRIAAVDLLTAAAIIAEVSPPGEAQAAALAVTAALTDAVVAYDHGQGVPGGRGVALYWPSGPATLDPLYAQISRLPNWAAYLSAFNTAPPPGQPRLTLDAAPREIVNIAQPALLRAELVARNVTEVALVADQEAADGRRVLRQYEVVQPASQTLPGGTNMSLWADGWHESLIVWDTSASYLSDAAGAGDYVPLRPVDASPNGSPLAAPGWFRRAAAVTTTEATVVFAPGAATSTHLWLAATVSSGARLLGEVRPAAGDIFQAALQIAGADGELTSEPGVALTYDENATILRSARPLPGGQYAVGLRVAALGSPPLVATSALSVDPAAGPTGYRAYVDANGGVQFLYPADWLPPDTRDGVTYTRNRDGTAQLQVRTYPGWTADLAGLQTEVLSTFGGVSLLQQEAAAVGSESPVAGIRTAYGYESAEQGLRTGTFLTFLKDGVGYVVDLDAPREAEVETLATLETIAATWQFLPPRLGLGAEPWTTLNIGEFRVRYPADYAYQEFNNWQRFAADPQTFVAARIQPAGRTPAEVMAALLQTAAEGVSNFTADEPQRLYYAGRVWERNDFSYTDPNGAIVSGLLLSRQDGEMEIAVWAEAPDPAGDLLETVFLPAAASIERIAPAPAG